MVALTGFRNILIRQDGILAGYHSLYNMKPEKGEKYTLN